LNVGMMMLTCVINATLWSLALAALQPNPEAIRRRDMGGCRSTLGRGETRKIRRYDALERSASDAPC
jgi:hypothetical protein